MHTGARFPFNVTQDTPRIIRSSHAPALQELQLLPTQARLPLVSAHTDFLSSVSGTLHPKLASWLLLSLCLSVQLTPTQRGHATLT